MATAERFIVAGPPRFKRRFHTKFDDAVKSATECSKAHPRDICRITYGLPGLQQTIVECSRSRCHGATSFGRRRRRK